ncbi:MAG: hypothetical protein D3917_18610, partial [Candidatus Electrothrix sp. AX5]|nr:hypothetical protein [Candidatus Electrothrix sp. AX5]
MATVIESDFAGANMHHHLTEQPFYSIPVTIYYHEYTEIETFYEETDYYMYADFFAKFNVPVDSFSFTLGTSHYNSYVSWDMTVYSENGATDLHGNFDSSEISEWGEYDISHSETLYDLHAVSLT